MSRHVLLALQAERHGRRWKHVVTELIEEARSNKSCVVLVDRRPYRVVALSLVELRFCWGLDDNRQVSGIPELNANETLGQISSGGYHTADIFSRGRALCWGLDDNRQVSGIPELIADEISVMISAGGYHTAAIFRWVVPFVGTFSGTPGSFKRIPGSFKRTPGSFLKDPGVL